MTMSGGTVTGLLISLCGWVLRGELMFFPLKSGL
jgi:hypothetical protein